MQDEFEKHIIENRDAFEMAEPPSGHQNRFAEKLKAQQKTKAKPNYIYKLMVAATIVILVGVGAMLFLREPVPPVVQYADAVSLRDVSPEMEEVEYYLTSSVSEKIKYLKSNFNEDNEHVLNCLKMVSKLEENYEYLKKELAKNPGEELIINTMVMNYQARVDVLEMLIEQLKETPDNYSITKKEKNEKIDA